MATRKKKNTNSEEKKPREGDGLFKPGNTIGSETRFKPGNTLSRIYKEEYADSLLEYFIETESRFPMIEEWATKNGLAIRTVYEWMYDEEKYPRFASTYAQCKEIQKQRLIQNGLADKYNAQIVKFMLVNNHGMKEKVDAEVKGSGGLTINIHEVSNGNP